VPGKGEPSRVLVLVTDLALVQKNVPGKGMLYVCDARTGQPLPEKSVRFYEHWQVYNQKNQRNDLFWDSTTATTDTNGLIFFNRKHAEQGSSVDAVVTGEQGRMAFSFFQNWNESAYSKAIIGRMGRAITSSPTGPSIARAPRCSSGCGRATSRSGAMSSPALAKKCASRFTTRRTPQ